MEFLAVEQVFELAFSTENVDSNPFNSLMSEALIPMYNATPDFIGVNILNVSEYIESSSGNTRRKRAT